jgi:hypothetical protein
LSKGTGKALYSYRVQSPAFIIGPLPNNNVFQSRGLTAPAGSSWAAVADGVQLMLQPLSSGHHFLKFYGEIDFADGSKFRTPEVGGRKPMHKEI